MDNHVRDRSPAKRRQQKVRVLAQRDASFRGENSNQQDLLLRRVRDPISPTDRRSLNVNEVGRECYEVHDGFQNYCSTQDTLNKGNAFMEI